MATEPAVSGTVATAVAILGNLEPTAAVAIAIPVGILGSYLYTLKIIVNSFVTKYIDRVVNNLEDKKFTFAIVVASALAAVGIAILIRIIGQKTDMFFFFLAFFLTIILKDLGITMVTWAVMGIVTAGIYTMIMINAKEAA